MSWVRCMERTAHNFFAWPREVLSTSLQGELALCAMEGRGQKVLMRTAFAVLKFGLLLFFCLLASQIIT